MDSLRYKLELTHILNGSTNWTELHRIASSHSRDDSYMYGSRLELPRVSITRCSSLLYISNTNAVKLRHTCSSAQDARGTSSKLILPWNSTENTVEFVREFTALQTHTEAHTKKQY